MRECVLNLATITDIPRVVVQGRSGALLFPPFFRAFSDKPESQPPSLRLLTPCPGLSPLGRRPLVALVYPTAEQAAATLIAVHCCTWSVKTQTSSNVRVLAPFWGLERNVTRQRRCFPPL